MFSRPKDRTETPEERTARYQGWLLSARDAGWRRWNESRGPHSDTTAGEVRLRHLIDVLTDDPALLEELLSHPKFSGIIGRGILGSEPAVYMLGVDPDNPKNTRRDQTGSDTPR